MDRRAAYRGDVIERARERGVEIALAAGQRGKAEFRTLRRVDAELRQAVPGQLRLHRRRRDVIRKLQLDRGKSGSRRRGKALDQRTFGEQMAEIGGKARHFSLLGVSLVAETYSLSPRAGRVKAIPVSRRDACEFVKQQFSPCADRGCKIEHRDAPALLPNFTSFHPGTRKNERKRKRNAGRRTVVGPPSGCGPEHGSESACADPSAVGRARLPAFHHGFGSTGCHEGTKARAASPRPGSARRHPPTSSDAPRRRSYAGRLVPEPPECAADEATPAGTALPLRPASPGRRPLGQAYL